jgi:predicted PurR-regulated permease PerM
MPLAAIAGHPYLYAAEPIGPRVKVRMYMQHPAATIVPTTANFHTHCPRETRQSLTRPRMLELEPPSAARPRRRLLLGSLAASLAALSLWVLAPFLTSIAWAAILAYVSWPAYRAVRRPLGRSPTAAALVMIALVTCVMLIPLLWLLLLLHNELLGSFRPITASLPQGAHSVAEGARRIPWLGAMLGAQLDRYLADPSILVRESMSWLQTWVGALAGVLGGLGRNLARVLLTLLLLFFFYRDGDTITRDLGRVARRLIGIRYVQYARTAGAITRAVFFGLILSAAAQGLIAGVGYRLAGLTAPVLLGAVTAVLSVVPLVGTALVWLPIAIGLLVAGAWGKGLLLLAWGIVLVHPTDNLLRPLLVSNAAKLPFLLVALGAIGGMAAFGLVGVFMGPVLLGLALELWLEWAHGAGRLPRRE